MFRKIALGHLDISERGKAYVNDALDHNRLSRGPYTDRFESEFSRLHGCKHGLFMNSGTSALQVALAALKEVHGYADGDEVLVPATTFIATSNVVIQNNLTPVFVDVDPFTFNIDPRLIEAAITSRTRVILPVHLFGLPADMGSVMEIAKRRNLQVIEDSCETMFVKHEGQSVGSFGHLACFSTYIAHILVGGVGGLVTTNDSKLMEICKSLMAHGRDSIYTNIDDDDNPTANILERRYRFERIGYSYRVTELEAAIALSELERWESNLKIRHQNAMHLTRELLDIQDHLQLPLIGPQIEHAFMMYPMVMRHEGRDEFLLFLEKNGIETRFLFPLLSQPFYQKVFPGLDDRYPTAQRLARDGFFIGAHQGLTTDDMDYVSQTIHGYFR